MIKLYQGRRYKLMFSTEERVGTILLAIKRIDNVCPPKAKRKRITICSSLDKFEENLRREIEKFKKQKKTN